MLGLPKGVVKLEIYNPQWVLEYEKERDILKKSKKYFLEYGEN